MPDTCALVCVDGDDDETVGGSGDVEVDGLDFTFGAESNMFIRMLYDSISNFRNMVLHSPTHHHHHSLSAEQ